MNFDRINHINSFFMLLSLAGSILLPIELFLFAYAILGPLHYLTEISWLHDRSYFSTSKKDAVWLLLITMIITVGYFSSKFQLWPELSFFFNHYNVHALLIILAFAMSAGFFFIRSNLIKFSYIALLTVICIFSLNTRSELSLLVSLTLPTLVHVYLFTGLFILLGTLKSKSKSSFISLVIFILSPYLLWILLPSFSNKITDYGVENFFKHNEGFGLIIYDLLAFLPEHALTPFSGSDLYDFKEELFLVRLLSFAYLYHYLNWFSKTEIIKWNQIPRSRLNLIIISWLFSCGIYLYDYALGMSMLFFLSYCHVVLEFPLNVRSLKEIISSFAPFIGKIN